MDQSPHSSHLSVDQVGSTLTIWFDRVEARNALSDAMCESLITLANDVAKRTDLRTVVLRGKGGVFCAGGDLKGFKSDMQEKTSSATALEDVATANRRFGHLMSSFNQLPQVVVALIEGAAIGGGLGLACVCDVTITTREAKFRLSETSLGIPPAQIAPFVIERVGFTHARRLMLTGASFDGSEAVRLGVAHQVVNNAQELEQAYAQVLKSVSYCAPGANASTKAILFNTKTQSRDQVLDFAAQEFAQCILSEEGREGLKAFIEKRKPSWASDPKSGEN